MTRIAVGVVGPNCFSTPRLLDREVVDEDPHREEQGHGVPDAVAHPRVELQPLAVGLGELLEARRQIGVEALDVPAVELHRVDVEQGHVRDARSPALRGRPRPAR